MNWEKIIHFLNFLQNPISKDLIWKPHDYCAKKKKKIIEFISLQLLWTEAKWNILLFFKFAAENVTESETLKYFLKHNIFWIKNHKPSPLQKTTHLVIFKQ